jgi:hypothetical protein
MITFLEQSSTNSSTNGDSGSGIITGNLDKYNITANSEDENSILINGEKLEVGEDKVMFNNEKVTIDYNSNV